MNSELIHVIDSHGHIGNWHDVPGEYFTPELVCESTSFNTEFNFKVEKVLVSTLAGIDTIDNQPGSTPIMNQVDANIDIISQCSKFPKLLPLAVCQPGFGTSDEILNLLKSNKFYGLKFHPFYLDLNASDELYFPFLKIAEEFSIPCFFHTAPGTSDPVLIYELAKNFPNLPIVLYHINITGDLRYGIDVAKQALALNNANLYLETSWCPPEIIIEAINTVGIDRVIFGTDVPLGIYSNKVNYATYVKLLINKFKKRFSKNSQEYLNRFFYSNISNLINL